MNTVRNVMKITVGTAVLGLLITRFLRVKNLAMPFSRLASLHEVLNVTEQLKNTYRTFMRNNVFTITTTTPRMDPI